MTISDHVQKVEKYGCKIVTCNPDARRIEAVIKAGTVVQVAVYNIPPVFRWPEVGESWLIRRENGTWILDSLWQEEDVVSPIEGLEPGDVVINAPRGVVHLSSGGVLSPGSHDLHFVFEKYKEGPPAAEWHIVHNLGKYPSVTIEDASGAIHAGAIEYINDNELKYIANAPFNGIAYLN